MLRCWRCALAGHDLRATSIEVTPSGARRPICGWCATSMAEPPKSLFPLREEDQFALPNPKLAARSRWKTERSGYYMNWNASHNTDNTETE
jgi:hypothetical protein